MFPSYPYGHDAPEPAEKDSCPVRGGMAVAEGIQVSMDKKPPRPWQTSRCPGSGSRIKDIVDTRHLSGQAEFARYGNSRRHENRTPFFRSRPCGLLMHERTVRHLGKGNLWVNLDHLVAEFSSHPDVHLENLRSEGIGALRICGGDGCERLAAVS